MVPMNQPVNALSMLNTFLKNDFNKIGAAETAPADNPATAASAGKCCNVNCKNCMDPADKPWCAASKEHCEDHCNSHWCTDDDLKNATSAIFTQ